MTTPKRSPTDAVRYAAFLRGINVGGHRLIKMDELARIVGGAGLRDVRTVIASGNVLFTSEETDAAALTGRIERALHDALSYEVTVFLRTTAHLQELVRLDPFGSIDDPAAKSYVTFLLHPPANVPPLPAHFPDEHFSVLGTHDAEVFTVAYKPPDSPRYGDYGKYLDKTFGKVTTTRTWNTIVKIAALH